MIFGFEDNIGFKSAKHEGSIVTPEATVTNLCQSGHAQRISFGLFFDF
jgi:hypothetical protein